MNHSLPYLGPTKQAVSLGLLVALILIGADRFYLQFYFPILEANLPSFSFIGLLSGVIYGGVVEEVLMQLFFMSVLSLDCGTTCNPQRL